MIDRVYSRYVAASIASLATDFSLFMLCLRLGVPAAESATLGYLAGVVCHWVLSVRAVFVGRVAETGTGRRQQQAMFLGSAMLGLAITASIVGLGARFGLDPRLAKVIAVLVSFQATYVVRKRVVFA